MAAAAYKAVLWIVGLSAIFVIAFLGVRVYRLQQGPPLEPWHYYAPRELSVAELDAADWEKYIAAEDAAFASINANVTAKLDADERAPFNRYFEGSPVNPSHFATDWNRSYRLTPKGEPVGAVVLLHGLTDSPYSLRHLAPFYRDRGFAVVAIRLPAHGTTPAALVDVTWEKWLSATRLAIREARRLAPGPAPLHIVGFSNGGTLALKYALDSIVDEKLPRPNRIVLLSPMVGVTAFARFAGLAGLPAIFPAFAKAAWLSVTPEFNPFKYNSFPVNGARQSWFLTAALQRQIDAMRRTGQLDELPPILTFQSVLDFTVSTRAVVTELYEKLPMNGSELVLFDINRSAKFGPLFRASSDAKLGELAPPRLRNFRLSIIESADADTDAVRERVIEPQQMTDHLRAIEWPYPRGVFSLSHVAIPFPLDDSLYGLQPDGKEDYGVHLGSLPLRGERAALIVNLEALVRMSSNPFFPYMLSRIGEGTPKAEAPAPERSGQSPLGSAFKTSPSSTEGPNLPSRQKSSKVRERR